MIFNRGLLWVAYSAASFLGKYGIFFPMLDPSLFGALFFDIFWASENLTTYFLHFLVLWCFIFQHLGKTCVFTRGFPFEFGLRCPGALFFSIWRSSFLNLLVAFGVVLGCLWVWSGRPGPGTVWVVFLDRRFAAQNGHMDSAQTHQNKRFSGNLCTKGGAQKSLEVTLVLPNVAIFPCLFANSGGRLSGQHGPVDALLNWLCCLGGLGGVF